MDNIDLKPGSYNATILKAVGDGRTFDFTFEVRKPGESTALLKELSVKMRAYHENVYPQASLYYATFGQDSDSTGCSFRAPLPQQYILVSDFVRETGLIGLTGELMVAKSEN